MPSSNKGLKTFQHLALHEPDKLVVFAMDGAKAKDEEGMAQWERRETGSLVGVLNGYAYCIEHIDQNKAFTVDDIVQIHHRCVDKVAHTNYDQHNTRNTGIRTASEQASFNLMPNSNLSVAGCKGLSEYIWQNMVDMSAPEYMFRPVSSAEDIAKILQDYADPESSDDPYTGFTPFIDGLTETQDHQTIPHRIQKVLDSLYDTLNHIANLPDIADADEHKIRAIVIAVQELERIHPFLDANCRTFCMVLLNALLMQQGLEPAIIDDPNKFDGFSVEELVECVKIGMEETHKLVEQETPYEYQDDAMLEPETDSYSSDNDQDSSQNEADAETETVDDNESNQTPYYYTNGSQYAQNLSEQLNEMSKNESSIDKFHQIKTQISTIRNSEKSNSCSDDEPKPILR